MLACSAKLSQATCKFLKESDKDYYFGLPHQSSFLLKKTRQKTKTEKLFVCEEDIFCLDRYNFCILSWTSNFLQEFLKWVVFKPFIYFQNFLTDYSRIFFWNWLTVIGLQAHCFRSKNFEKSQHEILEWYLSNVISQRILD